MPEIGIIDHREQHGTQIESRTEFSDRTEPSATQTRKWTGSTSPDHRVPYTPRLVHPFTHARFSFVSNNKASEVPAFAGTM